MGYPMAANIRKKMAPASTLYINDVSPACCETFRTEYASFGPIISVKTAREVAQECAVLVSIVPAAKHVKDVYLNPETGVVAASKNFNRLMVECSTVDVETAREVAQTLETATAGTYVDAPVSVHNTSLSFVNATFAHHRHAGWSSCCSSRNTSISHRQCTPSTSPPSS